MSEDELRTGCVIRFPYLWVREAERGETEGRKPRPVAVGVRIARPKGEDLLVLFPITSQRPSSDRFAAEIPEMEKRRAGLDVTLRLWVILENTIRTSSASRSTSSRSRHSAISAKRFSYL